MLRAAIVSVLGHVDHGKSSLLDAIRGTSIIFEEHGRITQAIGASIIPDKVIQEKAGNILKRLNAKLLIPGLLFIDTPGHAAFTSLRHRGGSIADLAVLVIDINEGFKPQTIEALNILKAFKTPFVIAANKLDLVPGFIHKSDFILEEIEKQQEDVKQEIYSRVYKLSSQLFKNSGLDGELFHRADFSKHVAIIPMSAKLGIGISELLAVLAGLSQKFLQQKLELHPEQPAKGVVLEVKEIKGLGTVIDVILYDGSLYRGDTIILAGLEAPIISKVKALLQPRPLKEMRSKKTRFVSINHVVAATGVRISAPNIDKAVAGASLMGLKQINEKQLQDIKKNIQKEVSNIIFETDKQGVIVKADALGSLEAVKKIFSDHNIAVRRTGIGNITKRDVLEADTVAEHDPLQGAVIGFSVNNSSPIKPKKAAIIIGNIIYKLLDDFKQWQSDKALEIEQEQLKALPGVCKIRVLPGYVFRQSNPAIVGVEVLAGKLKPGLKLSKHGQEISTIKSIELQGNIINEASIGKKVAISLPNITIGRQIKENDILYSFITEQEFRKLKELKHLLTDNEIHVLKEIADIIREKKPLWGI